MRCPKCGYITFDHLEVCTKCKKNIAAASEQLSGTVFQAEAPVFLQFEVASVDLEDDIALEVTAEDEDVEFDMSVDDVEAEGGGIEIGLMDEGVGKSAAPAFDDDDFDLPLSDDGVGLDLVEGSSENVVENSGPQLDFSELDISDLAPPADEPASGELTLEDTVVASSSAATSMGGSGGLEDLQMEGLDLEMPSLPPTGSATGEGMRPAVKTGTALDDFDIDLGDLTSGQK